MTEDEALLDGPGGENWKERWIRSKALLVEEQLGRTRGEHVALDEILPIFERLIAGLHEATELVELKHGANAADIMRTPIERLEEGIDAMRTGDHE